MFADESIRAMAEHVRKHYESALRACNAVDFDDLIRLALTLLESDEEYLERLRYRYPFILEDEAQDSSLTQERILSLLSGGRVGEARIETTCKQNYLGYLVVSICPSKNIQATRPPNINQKS